jgi:hypothetical protein
MTAKIFMKKVRRVEIVLIALTLIAPMLFYLYLFVPEVETVEVLGLEINFIEAHGLLQHLVWILAIKLLTLSILSLWFLSVDRWWRFFILVLAFHEFVKIFVNLFAVVEDLSSFQLDDSNYSNVDSLSIATFCFYFIAISKVHTYLLKIGVIPHKGSYAKDALVFDKNFF